MFQRSSERIWRRVRAIPQVFLCVLQSKTKRTIRFLCFPYGNRAKTLPIWESHHGNKVKSHLGVICVQIELKMQETVVNTTTLTHCSSIPAKNSSSSSQDSRFPRDSHLGIAPLPSENRGDSLPKKRMHWSRLRDSEPMRSRERDLPYVFGAVGFLFPSKPSELFL